MFAHPTNLRPLDREATALDKFDGIYKLHAALSDRFTPIARGDLLRLHECSEATFFQLIRAMRNYLGVPIELDDERGGYYYERAVSGGGYELADRWSDARELQALLAFDRLFGSLVHCAQRRSGDHHRLGRERGLEMASWGAPGGASDHSGA